VKHFPRRHLRHRQQHVQSFQPAPPFVHPQVGSSTYGAAADGLLLSSVGLGTYLGDANAQTDRAVEAAVERVVRDGGACMRAWVSLCLCVCVRVCVCLSESMREAVCWRLGCLTTSLHTHRAKSALSSFGLDSCPPSQDGTFWIRQSTTVRCVRSVLSAGRLNGACFT
jgi:hypothetical protein